MTADPTPDPAESDEADRLASAALRRAREGHTSQIIPDPDPTDWRSRALAAEKLSAGRLAAIETLERHLLGMSVSHSWVRAAFEAAASAQREALSAFRPSEKGEGA